MFIYLFTFITCINKCMCVRVYIYVYVCVCVCICLKLSKYTQNGDKKEEKN